MIICRDDQVWSCLSNALGSCSKRRLRWWEIREAWVPEESWAEIQILDGHDLAGTCRSSCVWLSFSMLCLGPLITTFLHFRIAECGCDTVNRLHTIWNKRMCSESHQWVPRWPRIHALVGARVEKAHSLLIVSRSSIGFEQAYDDE